jgi:ADP-ribose pyrophosphatase YjhB (NUDIX family)
MEAIRQLAFCGRCGAAAETQVENPGGPFRCTACGFTLFFNAASAVAAIIRREDGQALFVRRAKDPAKGKLGLPGGFVDPGENAEQALVREVREEVGLELRNLEYLSSHANRYFYAGVTYHTVDLFYSARADQPGRAAPLAISLDEMAFESMRAALRLLRERP